MPLGGEPYPKAEAPSLVNEPQHMRGNQMNRRKNSGRKEIIRTQLEYHLIDFYRDGRKNKK
jgi:hypothetical protein